MADRQHGRAALVDEEVVSARLVVLGKVHFARLVRAEQPGLGGRGRVFGRERDRELRSLEFGCAYRRGVACLLVDLLDEEVGPAVVGHLLGFERRGLAAVDGGALHLCVQGEAVGCGELLHVVRAQGEVLGFCVALIVSGHRRDLIGACLIGVDAVDCPGKRVGAVAAGNSCVRAALLDGDLSLRDIADDILVAVSGPECEARVDKACRRCRQLVSDVGEHAPRRVGVERAAVVCRVADDVVAGPLSELVARALQREAARARIDVGDDDVGERGVALVVHGGPVKPGGGEVALGLVEARAAEAVVDARGHLLDARLRDAGRHRAQRAFLVRARRRSLHLGLGAIRHGPVDVHPVGLVARVVDRASHVEVDRV